MKIKFIVPDDYERGGRFDQMGEGRVFAPIGLAKMAAIASSQHEVSYHDERIEKVNHALQADVVIIFINSYNRLQAYNLAKYYRTKGSYVVFTGAILEHSPEDAYGKADCLFIGAGQEIMQKFLDDYSNGKKCRSYGNMLNPIVAVETSSMRLVS